MRRGAPVRDHGGALVGVRRRCCSRRCCGRLPSRPSQDFDAEAFHAYVEQAVADWDATGLAVAVIRGQELLFARGYGALELGKPETVDPDTLFSIGSTTQGHDRGDARRPRG